MLLYQDTLVLLYYTDVNECDLSYCHTSAACTNTLGSYNCQCNSGYTGNGTFCEGKWVINIWKCSIKLIGLW